MNQVDLAGELGNEHDAAIDSSLDGLTTSVVSAHPHDEGKYPTAITTFIPIKRTRHSSGLFLEGSFLQYSIYHNHTELRNSSGRWPVHHRSPQVSDLFSRVP